MRGQEELTLNERTTHLVEYWKQTTLVQQHFNDISMKVRNFAIVIFSGFLTGVGLSIHNGIFVELIGFKFSAGIIFSFAGAFVTQLIHFMDTYWYHVFLKGAVTSSVRVEKEINEILKIDKLADGISSQSQNVSIISLFGIIHFPIGANFSGDSYYIKFKRLFFKEVKVDSTLRHKIFYRWLIVIILLTGVGSLFTTIPNDKNHAVRADEKAKIINISGFFNYPMRDEKLNELNEVNEVNNKEYVVTATNLRLRLFPDFSSQIIDILPAGKLVTIIDDTNVSWLNVELSKNNKKIYGWLYREHITKVQD